MYRGCTGRWRPHGAPAGSGIAAADAVAEPCAAGRRLEPAPAARRQCRHRRRPCGRAYRRCRMAGAGLPGAVHTAAPAPGQASPAQPPRAGNPAQAACTGTAHRTGWPAAGRHRCRQRPQPQPRTPAAGRGGDRPGPASGRMEFALPGTVPFPAGPSARGAAHRGTVPLQRTPWPARSRPGRRGHRASPEPSAQRPSAHARK